MYNYSVLFILTFKQSIFDVLLSTAGTLLKLLVIFSIYMRDCTVTHEGLDGQVCVYREM